MLKKISNEVDSSICVVLLHGFGADEYNLLDLGEYFSPAHVVSFQAPIDLSSQGYIDGRAWFSLDFTPYGIEYDEEEMMEAVKLLTKEVKSLRKKFDKLYLCGFSQGAILSHALFLGNEVRIDGIAGLSGRYNELIFKIEQKEGIKDRPVFLSHGIFDEVIPISSGRQIVDYYKSSGVVLFSEEYSFGHEIDKSCKSNLRNWFKGVQ